MARAGTDDRPGPTGTARHILSRRRRLPPSPAAHATPRLASLPSPDDARAAAPNRPSLHSPRPPPVPVTLPSIDRQASIAAPSFQASKPHHGGTPLGLHAWWGACSIGTNLDGVGLASADRNNKATLPLTAPSRAIKSSAKDLSLRIVKLPYGGKDLKLFRRRPRYHPRAIQGPGAYSYPTTMCRGKNHRFLAWILT